MPNPEISYKSSQHWRDEVACFQYPGPVYFHHLPSYDELFSGIFVKNQLCIIASSVTASWNSRKLWVSHDGCPNFQYISENFGEAAGPVADCNAEAFCAHPKTEMTVKAFVSYWQKHKADGYPSDGRCLYLKDWHFTKDFPSYSAYSPPEFFCSDWLNEFWDVTNGGNTSEDDYRFVYMGLKGSWTPFHSDVLRSYSWSANICGRKKWIFFPPGVEEMLKDSHGQLIFDLRSPDLTDVNKYPQALIALEQAIVVIQNPGEIIFVPSGWHHQVFNMEDTISINHNWMTGCSIRQTWSYLKERLVAVQSEISDCRDMDGWDSQCQMILKADAGIDYHGFYMLMVTIAKNRIFALKEYLKKFKVGMCQGTQVENNNSDMNMAYYEQLKPHDKNLQIQTELKTLKSDWMEEVVHACVRDKAEVRCSKEGGGEVEGHNNFEDYPGCDSLETHKEGAGYRNLCKLDRSCVSLIQDKVDSEFGTACKLCGGILSTAIKQSEEEGLLLIFDGKVHEHFICWQCYCKNYLCRQSGGYETDLVNSSATDNGSFSVSGDIPIAISSDGRHEQGDSRGGEISLCLLHHQVVSCEDDHKESCVTEENNPLSHHCPSDSSSLETENSHPLPLEKDEGFSSFQTLSLTEGNQMILSPPIRHEACPHWAHCGPNLALFDLHCVADILKELTSQKEFCAIKDSLPGYLPLLQNLISDLTSETNNIHLERAEAL